MKVTAAIVCHKQQHLVHRAIGSVLAQTHRPDQIVLCGTDLQPETARELQRYADMPGVQVLLSSETLPNGAAKNLALSVATGDAAFVLDADDFLHPGYVRACLTPLEQGQGDVAGTLYFTAGPDWIEKQSLPSVREVIKSNPLPCCSLFLLSAFRAVGGFDVTPYDDWVLWIKMHQAGFRLYRVDSPLFFYCRHAGNSTTNVNDADAEAEVRRLTGTTAKQSCCGSARGDAPLPEIKIDRSAKACRLLIGALSGASMAAHRDGCRASWVADAQLHPALDVVFLLGAKDHGPERQGDELFLPCPDAYAALPQRTRWFCRWALQRTDWQHLFKCDDDTFVAVERLAQVDLTDCDYAGRDLGGWASGGAGYFLSRRAAQIVADEMTARTGDEDVCVAKALARHGIRLRDDKRFQPWPSAGPLPAVDNDSITGHGISSSAFWECQRQTGKPWRFRIVMPTSNRYAATCGATLTLLDRYWPGHPPVDVLHYDMAPAPHLDVRTLCMGAQARVTWTVGLAEYLRAHNTDETILLMLDDYGLCRLADVRRIKLADQVLRNDPALTSISLTWEPIAHRATPYGQHDEFLCFPRWDYSVNTQARLWRREALARILAALGPTTIEEFELAGSRWHNAHAYPAQRTAGLRIVNARPSGFVDETDKSAWALAYHNLVRRGQADPRHQEFLRAHKLRIEI